MPADLEGRTAIVTGGARGIGEAIVQRLAEAGCNLVINCHTSVDAAEALAETVRAGGSGAEVVAGSIADPAPAGCWRRGRSRCSAGSTFWSTTPGSIAT